MSDLAVNKKARFDYEILEDFEAGLVLFGHEVKSVRAGRMALNGAYVTIAHGTLLLVGAQIQKYPQAGPLPDYDPQRTRTLLVHKRELDKLTGKMEQKGFTLVPLSVYAKGSKLKLKFGLGRGKKEFQKKDAIKKRDLDRESRRVMRGED